ncbi:MAG: arabinose isomerase [Lentisphaerae bacterium]|jgi:L-arabinose isomerase|nr:arabinose isomerase [Lentisphaerota bacterium]
MRVERRKPLRARVGVMSIGLDTYWGQFPGLLDELMGKVEKFKGKLNKYNVEIVDFGMVDNSEKAYALLPKMLGSDLDVLFVDMVTYGTSGTFGIIVQSVSCPVVLVALQPMAAMDYAHGTTYMQLCNDDVCSVPEFTGVAIRMGRRVSGVVIGQLEGDAIADAELAEWIGVARVRHDLRKARLGLMGHVLDTMLDMQADPTAITAAFGAHIVPCEAEEIMIHYRKITSEERDVTAMKARILDFFDTPDPVSDPLTTKLTDHDLDLSARVAVALERFVAAKRLDGFAYYYEGEPDSKMRELVTNFIVGNSLLTGAGFPMCGEFDIKTCVAMMMMDRLDIGGSFAEFHPIDFVRDTVLVGHDGPHHVNIADRRPVLRSLSRYHGKPGTGAGVEFNIKTGPITILSIGMNENGKPKMVVAQGESLPGPIPPTGNTNTHGKFKPDVRTFLKRWVMEGPTHHFALGIGHHASTLEKVADSFGVECAVISESI